MAFIRKMLCDNCDEASNVPEDFAGDIEDFVPDEWWKGPVPVPGMTAPTMLLCNPCIWAIDSALTSRRKHTPAETRPRPGRRRSLVQTLGATDDRSRPEQAD